MDHGFSSLIVSNKSEKLINLNISHNHGEFRFFSGRSKFVILNVIFKANSHGIVI